MFHIDTLTSLLLSYATLKHTSYIYVQTHACEFRNSLDILWILRIVLNVVYHVYTTLVVNNDAASLFYMRATILTREIRNYKMISQLLRWNHANPATWAHFCDSAFTKANENLQNTGFM